MDYRDRFYHGVSLGGVIVTVIPSEPVGDRENDSEKKATRELCLDDERNN